MDLGTRARRKANGEIHLRIWRMDVYDMGLSKCSGNGLGMAFASLWNATYHKWQGDGMAISYLYMRMDFHGCRVYRNAAC